MLPHEWSTRRLSLRPPCAEDAKAIFQGWPTDATVTRYLSWRPHRRLEDTREFVERCLEAWRAGPPAEYGSSRTSASADSRVQYRARVDGRGPPHIRQLPGPTRKLSRMGNSLDGVMAKCSSRSSSAVR
jgi:Acetyltransferase (GNAT) domain